MILNNTMYTDRNHYRNHNLRIWLLAFCLAAVYTKSAFGQSCPSATLKQNLNFNQSAGTVMTSNKYNRNSSMVSHSWQPISGLPGQREVQFVTAHPENPNYLFIGSSGNLYASFNQGGDWKQLIGLGTHAKINGLYFDQKRMLLLTSEGLFESNNQGKHWKNIFKGRESSESNVLSLSRNPQNSKIFYLGTEGGLFLSRNNGRSWQKETNELAHQFIRKLETDFENNEIFIASNRGLYRIIPERNRLDRVYVMRGHASPEEIESKSEVGDEEDLKLQTDQDRIHAILIVNHPSSIIAIGTRNGIFVSEDEGNRWERLSLSGLQDAGVLDLAYSAKKNSFFVATENGVYSYDRSADHWVKFEEGLSSVRINRLTLVSNEREMLYAATDGGVYRIMIEIEPVHPEIIRPFPEKRWNLASKLFRMEPTVGMIQKQAIRYANVSNWKTKRWQWASRLRVLIPTLSAGKSFSTSDTVDLDRAGTNDPDRYILGPQDKTHSWDFDLKWDLADLLWNTAQTSIDSREKLMVELRDDILSEATRLYFERRRTQAEFILRPPADLLEQTDQLLRIEELTASLDGLTGGYVTKELDRLYSQHPEFQEIWNPPAESNYETETT